MFRSCIYYARELVQWVNCQVNRAVVLLMMYTDSINGEKVTLC
jgi:hypothetical protein